MYSCPLSFNLHEGTAKVCIDILFMFILLTTEILAFIHKELAFFFSFLDKSIESIYLHQIGMCTV